MLFKKSLRRERGAAKRATVRNTLIGNKIDLRKIKKRKKTKLLMETQVLAALD